MQQKMQNSEDRKGSSLGLWFAVVAVIALADQLTKWAVVQSSIMDGPIVLTPFLRLIYAENTGSAFSFLAEQGAWARWLLVVLAAAISIFLAVWLVRRPPPLESFALALILGGAIGNLCDRIRLGYVVDFIDAHIGTYHWPTFNIADSGITIGIVVLLWLTFFDEKKTEPPCTGPRHTAS